MVDGPIPEGAVVGFDADGKLTAVALIMPTAGMTEAMCFRDCRAGNKTVRRVSQTEAIEIMKEHKWGCE